MSVISTGEIVKIDLNKSVEGSEIEAEIIKTVSALIGMAKEKYNMTYEDNTYREIMLLCQDFAKRLGETLYTQNTNQQIPMGGDVENRSNGYL